VTIDQRLEFLVQSTESLHASCQQLHAMMTEQARQTAARFERQEQREAQFRRAVLASITEYLRALDEEEGTDGEGKQQ
jgi:hypothetical protein